MKIEGDNYRSKKGKAKIKGFDATRRPWSPYAASAEPMRALANRAAREFKRIGVEGTGGTPTRP